MTSLPSQSPFWRQNARRVAYAAADGAEDNNEDNHQGGTVQEQKRRLCRLFCARVKSARADDLQLPQGARRPSKHRSRRMSGRPVGRPPSQATLQKRAYGGPITPSNAGRTGSGATASPVYGRTYGASPVAATAPPHYPGGAPMHATPASATPVAAYGTAPAAAAPASAGVPLTPAYRPRTTKYAKARFIHDAKRRLTTSARGVSFTFPRAGVHASNGVSRRTWSSSSRSPSCIRRPCSWRKSWTLPCCVAGWSAKMRYVARPKSVERSWKVAESQAIAC